MFSFLLGPIDDHSGKNKTLSHTVLVQTDGKFSFPLVLTESSWQKVGTSLYHFGASEWEV